MKNFKENSKRFFFAIVLIVVILAVMITVNITLERKMNIEPGNTAEKDTYQYHIAMIGNNPSDDFWMTVYEEGKKAGAKMDCYIENFGANLKKDYTTTDLMEMAIASKVDGIILQADQGEALKDLINEAAASEIPVVTILNDVPNSKRISFVSCNDFAVGEMYGNQILEAIEIDHTDENSNKRVAVLVNSARRMQCQTSYIPVLPMPQHRCPIRCRCPPYWLTTVENSNPRK